MCMCVGVVRGKPPPAARSLQAGPSPHRAATSPVGNASGTSPPHGPTTFRINNIRATYIVCAQPETFYNAWQYVALEDNIFLMRRHPACTDGMASGNFRAHCDRSTYPTYALTSLQSLILAMRGRASRDVRVTTKVTSDKSSDKSR